MNKIPQQDCDSARTLHEALCDVLRYRRGLGEYDFSRLSAKHRANAAHDAWQELEDRISCLVGPVQ